MHILEDHVIGWVKKYNTGFGLLGEQGIESIHHQFNELHRTYANIRKGEDQLQISFQVQWIPRAENELADYLSRIRDPDDYMLNPLLFRLIVVHRDVVFDIDRMAGFVKGYLCLPKSPTMFIPGEGCMQSFANKKSVFSGTPKFNVLALKVEF
ncbi:hypothetical protein AC249_AIPGENE3655 [Exaiptasia diaphana]|nr:hypothetical protein AC249_AIPGENE3655 [Exaiptasia diaphana]